MSAAEIRAAIAALGSGRRAIRRRLQLQQQLDNVLLHEQKENSTNESTEAAAEAAAEAEAKPRKVASLKRTATFDINTARQRKRKTDTFRNRVVSSQVQSNVSSEDPPIYVTNTHSCDECGGPLRRKELESILVCESCGLSKHFTNMTATATAHDDSRAYQSFSYRRDTHFREWLLQAQGKQSKHIPEELLNQISRELAKNEIKTLDITADIVRSILKKLSKANHYENSVLICSLLRGDPAERFAPDVEEELMRMFKMIQKPFDNACNKLRNETGFVRKNFLSYSYCCRKLIEILVHRNRVDKSWLHRFKLLRGQEKRQRMDSLWQLMCEELNWPFFPSC
jgi:ribosomal protein L37AE/L43A